MKFIYKELYVFDCETVFFPETLQFTESIFSIYKQIYQGNFKQNCVSNVVGKYILENL